MQVLDNLPQGDIMVGMHVYRLIQINKQRIAIKLFRMIGLQYTCMLENAKCKGAVFVYVYSIGALHELFQLNQRFR